MIRYNSMHEGYFCAGAWHSPEQIFGWYRLKNAFGVEGVLRLAYKTCFGTEAEKSRIEMAASRYKATKELPGSVLSTYVHGQRQELLAAAE